MEWWELLVVILIWNATVVLVLLPFHIWVERDRRKTLGEFLAPPRPRPAGGGKKEEEV